MESEKGGGFSPFEFIFRIVLLAIVVFLVYATLKHFGKIH
jgi:hypothetical protein